MPTSLKSILAAPPTNAWLLLGDQASYPDAHELRDMRRAAPGDYVWTAPKRAQPGDLLFFYFIAPHKAIHFAARAASHAFFDRTIGVNARKPVDPNQWWVEHTPLVELHPVPYAELQELMGGHLILRGRPQQYLPPKVAKQLIGRAPGRKIDPLILQTPVGSPDLPNPARVQLPGWRGLADGPLKLETQVEEYVVKPLLRLCLPQSARFQQGYRLTSGGRPDFVILNSDKPRAVIEVKVGVRQPQNDDWGKSPDFQQVSRYAREIDVPAALIDTNQIFLIHRRGKAPFATIQRSRATASDLKRIGRHLTGSGD